MKDYAVRLTRGMPLKESIAVYCHTNHILSGVVLSAVGSLSVAHLRNAGAQRVITLVGPLEIVELNGTISADGIHLHLTVADGDLRAYGGHLMDGCLVDTTCELVIGELECCDLTREYDPQTGYRELVVSAK